MSDPVLSAILTQIAAILHQQIDREVRLVAGVKKELTKLETELISIKAVIVDAERRQAKEEQIKNWLESLRYVACDADDVLCEWITATKKAQIADHEKHKVLSSLMFLCVGFNRVIIRRDIGLKIKGINERLVEISKLKDRYGLKVVTETGSFDRPKAASYVVETQLIGRDSDSYRIVSMLLSDGNQQKLPNVLSIIGMGGIGKTTVAQMVYKAEAVVNHFESRVWVCVTDLFDEIRIAKAIIEDLEGHGSSLCELETATRKIRSLLEGKKLLLVLDDVWTEDFCKWEQLFNSLSVCAAGSVVMVTTQKETVANAMGSRDKIHLRQLSAEHSWSLFKEFALLGRSEQECLALESVGQKLADKCKGLPFSLKTIASLMRFKKSENDWLDVLNSEFWELREAQGLFPPLMLSYYDLPPPVRQCFSYCAFFPKDHVIEADNLVKLWIAQGYLISSENVEMEILGREFVENLTTRSFFQDIKKDRDGKGILSFKMHNMVHDFALYLNRNDFSAVKITNGSEQNLERACHSILIRSEDIRFPGIHNAENLVSLWVQAFNDSPRIVVRTESINPTFFLGLNRIKSLDLSRNMIGELPMEIGKLMKLRYLNLSHNPLVELPLTLSELFNLQTLKLNHCYHLKRLPSEMRKLINLRHLEISHTDSLKALPKGTGRLVSLQTLSKFIVAHVRESSVCGIEDLNNLNNLRGCLKIEGLGCVSGATEARKAELKKKTYLSEVHMDFSPCTVKGRREEVIQALQLHENLQSLQVSSYGGNRFPGWFMQLKNLRKLYLQDCRNCSDLPPLGRLPSLTNLQLEGLKAIKCLKIGVSSATPSNEQQALFPKLKKLKILKMENWEEWQVTDAELHDENLVMFPCLKILKVSHCVKVKALPIPLLQGSPIEKLRIQDCPFLQQKYNKRTGEHWNQVSHIPKIRIS